MKDSLHRVQTGRVEKVVQRPLQPKTTLDMNISFNMLQVQNILELSVAVEKLPNGESPSLVLKNMCKEAHNSIWKEIYKQHFDHIPQETPDTTSRTSPDIKRANKVKEEMGKLHAEVNRTAIHGRGSDKMKIVRYRDQQAKKNHALPVKILRLNMRKEDADALRTEINELANPIYDKLEQHGIRTAADQFDMAHQELVDVEQMLKRLRTKISLLIPVAFHEMEDDSEWL